MTAVSTSATSVQLLPVLLPILGSIFLGVLSAVGGFAAARMTYKGSTETNQETTAGTILGDVWSMVQNLNQRVSNLEAERSANHWLLQLSRGHIVELHEGWPEEHLEARPGIHADLAPFVETGHLPSASSGATVQVEVKT